MDERPLTLKEVRESAKRAADHIEKTWPQWKKDLSKVTTIYMKIKDGKVLRSWSRTEDE